MAQNRTSPLFVSLRRWHQSTYVPYENDTNWPLVRMGGYYQRPVVAKAIDAAVEFYLKHWKWCLTTMVAVIAFTIQFVRTH